MCEKMDGVGLRNYAHNHFKDRIKIQAELPGALWCAPDPAELILDSMEGFHGVDDGSKGLDLRKIRRSCVILLKQFRVAALRVSFKAREKALKLAMSWRENLMAGDANISGALGFLHFVSAFGLISEFSKEDLVDFSVMAAINEDTPVLCRAIGMTDRVSAFVEESEKLAKRLSEEGKSLMETTARETHALKSVIKIIENHNLESEYPRASLEQRIKQLKKQKRINMNCATPASIGKAAQHQQQQKQQQQKGNMLKQKQKQQSGIKRPRKSTPVGPAAVLNDNSTMHQYHQLHLHPTGLFPEHLNIPRYTGPSA